MAENPNVLRQYVVDPLSVIVILKLAQIERTYVAESRHAFISPTASGVARFVDWCRLIWVDQADFAKSFEDLAFHCICNVLLHDQAFVVHPQVGELKRNSNFSVVLEVVVFLRLLPIIALVLLNVCQKFLFVPNNKADKCFLREVSEVVFSQRAFRHVDVLVLVVLFRIGLFCIHFLTELLLFLCFCLCGCVGFH